MRAAFHHQSNWPQWPGVPGWGVPPEFTVDERQRHHRSPGPHLHCQRGGLRSGERSPKTQMVIVLYKCADSLYCYSHKRHGFDPLGTCWCDVQHAVLHSHCFGWIALLNEYMWTWISLSLPVVTGNGEGAEIGRSKHPGDGEEQEGVHWSNGEVEGGARGGAADASAGQRLLRGTSGWAKGHYITLKLSGICCNEEFHNWSQFELSLWPTSVIIWLQFSESRSVVWWWLCECS